MWNLSSNSFLFITIAKRAATYYWISNYPLYQIFVINIEKDRLLSHAVYKIIFLICSSSILFPQGSSRCSFHSSFQKLAGKERVVSNAYDAVSFSEDSHTVWSKIDDIIVHSLSVYA